MVLHFVKGRGSTIGRTVRRPWRWVPFAVRLRVAQLRRWASRRRAARRTFIVVPVLVVVAMGASAVSELRTARASLGDTVAVYVVTDDVAIGETLDDTVVEQVKRPVSHLPADVLLEPLADEIAARELRGGDVVTRRDLRSTRGIPALRKGQRAVSLPRHPAIPQLSVGDMVDIHVAGEFDVDPVPAQVGLVIGVSDEAYTVALDKGSVRDVASAAAAGQVVIARR